ncbi:hypothetical protein [Streptomyces sp. SPB162]|uniref:hypothetical protein n=1 Tax=Streptomyces sp. SPB162 TaxID=2940560 RepID=UPI00240711A4|nr:hypothetical protein [Streptomyces sp. SPB162]MDF9815761.1 hypothetical protein [Streptomyces sp. SPB162]
MAETASSVAVRRAVASSRFLERSVPSSPVRTAACASPSSAMTLARSPAVARDRAACVGAASLAR